MITRYLCPISGCDWHHDDPDVPVGSWPWKGSIEKTVFAVEMSRVQAVDQIISAHLLTHPVLEWFTEVRRQQNRADAAEAKLAAWLLAIEQVQAGAQ